MNPYAIIGALVLAISLAGGGYYQGWERRGDREAAIQLEKERQAARDLDNERKRGDVLAGELELAKREVRTVAVEVVKEIPKVTTVYIEVPGEAAKPIPPAVITFGAVRLYNRALRPDLPGTAGEFAYPSGATDATRAPVDTPDILAVHAENGAKYAECRAQLNALIDWHQGRKPAQ